MITTLDIPQNWKKHTGGKLKHLNQQMANVMFLCNLLLGMESSYCRLLLGTNTLSTVIGGICKVWDLWVFKLSCTHQKNGNLNRRKEDSHWNFHSYI